MIKKGKKTVLFNYECLPDTEGLLEIIESLAYRVAHYEHPSWYAIPDEEIIRILKEEGIYAYIEGKKNV